MCCMLLQLLSNLLEWDDLLAPAALKHLTFTCLVNRYILIGLASLMSTTDSTADASEVAVYQVVVGRLKAITTHLPSEWLTDLEDSQLAQLRRFVSQLIERLSPTQESATAVPTGNEMEMRSVLFK